MQYLPRDILIYNIYHYFNVTDCRDITRVCRLFYEIIPSAKIRTSQLYPNIKDINSCIIHESYYMMKNIIISIHKQDVNYVLKISALYGNMQYVQNSIRQCANDFNWAMSYAAINNNRELVDYFISLGANNFNWAMACAANNNHRELVDYLFH